MKIFEKINNDESYKKIFKNSYPYVLGGILLAIVQIINFTVTGSPWGVTGVLANWGASIFELFGGSVENWHFFEIGNYSISMDYNLLNSPESMRNIGIVIGALISTLLASEFKFKKIKNIKQISGAILGGLLMGYGARIAFGCNIGALFSGIASLSLSGWIYGIFMFFGVIVGSKILVKYLI